MPGAYAHITLVNELSDVGFLEHLPGFPTQAIQTILKYFKFCELGSVSPDFPYLDFLDPHSTAWADIMHTNKTGEFLHNAVAKVSAMKGTAQQKSVAWLLGFSAHVVADVCIHPVVNLKVGPYPQNKTKHRVCEMNEDVYIFERLNLGDLGLSEHLKSGIGACMTRNDLDKDIVNLWKAILSQVHGNEYDTNPPMISKWHNAFMTMVDKIAEEGDKLLPIARHVAANTGLVYPAEDDLAQKYLVSLPTPLGPRNYDLIFDKAKSHTADVWCLLARGIYESDTGYLTQIANWSLDTGQDGTGQIIFWRTT